MLSFSFQEKCVSLNETNIRERSHVAVEKVFDKMITNKWLIIIKWPIYIVLQDTDDLIKRYFEKLEVLERVIRDYLLSLL